MDENDIEVGSKIYRIYIKDFDMKNSRVEYANDNFIGQKGIVEAINYSIKKYAIRWFNVFDYKECTSIEGTQGRLCIVRAEELFGNCLEKPYYAKAEHGLNYAIAGAYAHACAKYNKLAEYCASQVAPSMLEVKEFDVVNDAVVNDAVVNDALSNINKDRGVNSEKEAVKKEAVKKEAVKKEAVNDSIKAYVLIAKGNYYDK